MHAVSRHGRGSRLVTSLPELLQFFWQKKCRQSHRAFSLIGGEGSVKFGAVPFRQFGHWDDTLRCGLFHPGSEETKPIDIFGIVHQ